MKAVRNADGGVVFVTFCFLVAERKILANVAVIRSGKLSGLSEAALTLAVLALQKVAGTLLTAHNLPCTSHFETLGNGLPCLCFSSDSWHGADNLGAPRPLTRQK